MRLEVTLESYDPNLEKPKGGINHSRDTLSILTTRINGHKNDSSNAELESLSLESMVTCSRFEFCSVQICPLDPLIEMRYEDPSDPKCEMAKATRHKYWESLRPELRSMLPYKGYLETEFNRMRAARERWNSLSEDEKAAIRERMRNVGKAKQQ